MRKLLGLLFSGVAVLSLAGCFMTFPHRGAKPETHVVTGVAPAYSGPRARLSVADFDVQTPKATAEIGAGLREMLCAALASTDRFSVAQRQGSGADLVIMAAVTEFEPQASGGSAGIGGGGGSDSGFLGGLLGTTLNKAHITLDISVVDASTSTVLAQTRVQGQASDIAGGFMTGSAGGLALGGGLSAYANTPMEKAIRICIIEATRYLAQAIPTQYYKY